MDLEKNLLASPPPLSFPPILRRFFSIVSLFTNSPIQSQISSSSNFLNNYPIDIFIEILLTYSSLLQKEKKRIKTRYFRITVRNIHLKNSTRSLYYTSVETRLVFDFRRARRVSSVGADSVSLLHPKISREGFASVGSQVDPSRDRYADSRKRFAVAHLGPIKIALNYGCPRRGLLPPLPSPLISKFMNPPPGTGGTTTVFVER